MAMLCHNTGDFMHFALHKPLDLKDVRMLDTECSTKLAWVILMCETQGPRVSCSNLGLCCQLDFATLDLRQT